MARVRETLVSLFFAQLQRFRTPDILGLQVTLKAELAVKPCPAFGPNGAQPVVTDTGRCFGAELSGEESCWALA